MNGKEDLSFGMSLRRAQSTVTHHAVRAFDVALAKMQQMDASGHITLQLGVSTHQKADDSVEELRAELDRMEHGGEDADDAHMQVPVRL